MGWHGGLESKAIHHETLLAALFTAHRASHGVGSQSIEQALVLINCGSTECGGLAEHLISDAFTERQLTRHKEELVHKLHVVIYIF